MEGRVQAQNDEFGHSRVDTHAHTQKSQMLQCPDGCTEKPVRADGAGVIFLPVP